MHKEKEVIVDIKEELDNKPGEATRIINVMY